MLTSALVFLAGFAGCLRIISPGIALEDSGEFATAAATLTITHPPGYPLYILAGKLVSMVPLGSPGFRLALLSTACAALSAALLFSLVRRLLGPGHGLLPAFAGLALAATPALAQQAAISDKYALATAFACGLFLLCHSAWRDGRTRLPPLAFFFGLALSHHMTALYIAPALLALLWREKPWKEPRAGMVLVFFFGLGFSVKAVSLTLLSLAAPSLMYDRLDSYAKLSGYLAATSYSGRFVAFTNVQKIARLWTHGILTLWREAGPVVLAFAAAGAWRAWREFRPAFWAGAAGTAFALVLVANFQIAGVDYYLLPITALVCTLAALGAGLVRPLAGKWGASALGAVLLVSTAWRGLPVADVSRYYGATDWGRNLLASSDEDAVLLTQHDDDFFPVMYLTRVLEERPDVAIVHRPMLTRLWYHAQVERLHPGFQTLDKDIIPWGKTVEPDMLINLFIRSHLGKRELAFSYIPVAELAGGFRAVPDGMAFRLGRREDKAPPPTAAVFYPRFARFRSRYVFGDYEGRNFRFKEVGGAFSASWTQLAVLWFNRDKFDEARNCFRQAVLYPYTRVKAEDMEQLRYALFGTMPMRMPESKSNDE